MVNTEIKLIIFFAAKDGEALYSQQKQDQELTVAQIMNSFCQTLPTPLPQFYVLRGTSHCLKLIIRKGSIRPMRERAWSPLPATES